MKQFEVNGRMYSIRDIPPSIQPLLSTYANLSKPYSNAEEAIKAADELDKIIKEIFKRVGLEPMPQSCDESLCLIKIMELINEAFSSVKFLRQRFTESSGELSISDSSKTE
ncbi:MAG: hypothetical protein N3F06_01385 [Nitrososphaerales archaeon]|nr:hypothetical protein [Nitrososphaerales archaeon]